MRLKIVLVMKVLDLNVLNYVKNLKLGLPVICLLVILININNLPLIYKNWVMILMLLLV